MNILIDIGHPAHVHYYRNLANELEKRGHQVFWSLKKIDIAQHLLNYYGFKYFTLPKKSDDLFGKVWKQFLYDLILLKICIQEKIDIAIGTSVSIAHISKISRVKSIVFDDDDDDIQPLVTKYVNPFATSLLSPEALQGKRKRLNTIYYPGYHELAYLHPKRFKPDPGVLGEMGIKPDETYFLMRFNVFKAHHDVGISGLSLKQKLTLIDILKPIGRIFITTERSIEPELIQYQLKVSPEKIHTLMYYATIFLGDSQTMTSEAAVLGVPSLRCNSLVGRISYLEEEEHKYGLTFGFLPTEFDHLLIKLRELLNTPYLKEEWQKRRERMLSEKIDVTGFWLWFIENYPQSKSQIANTTKFWEQFK
jgi:predicted glycosyltransferase